MSQQTLPSTPPKKKLSRVGSFFSYRCLVSLKKCPQRKACTFQVKSPKNVFFLAYSPKLNFDKLNII